jgi:hypothetical protein
MWAVLLTSTLCLLLSLSTICPLFYSPKPSSLRLLLLSGIFGGLGFKRTTPPPPSTSDLGLTFVGPKKMGGLDVRFIYCRP